MLVATVIVWDNSSETLIDGVISSDAVRNNPDEIEKSGKAIDELNNENIFKILSITCLFVN